MGQSHSMKTSQYSKEYENNTNLQANKPLFQNKKNQLRIRSGNC